MMEDFSVRTVDDLCPFMYVLVHHFVLHHVEFKLVKAKYSCYSLILSCMCCLQIGVGVGGVRGCVLVNVMIVCWLFLGLCWAVATELFAIFFGVHIVLVLRV